MQGIAWHIFTFGAIGVSLILVTCRTVALIRSPIHLRWELAPVPRAKGKHHYGGSYLEEYEWWDKPKRKSHIAPWIYMAKEIFLLRAVWEKNRSLWPFTFSFHIGLYLLVGMLCWLVINAVFLVADFPSNFMDIPLKIGSVFEWGGYLLGSLGSIGLILKRALDPDFKPFNTKARYFNLLFLNAVFMSGVYARFALGDTTSEMSLFIKSIMTFDATMTVAFPLSLHLVILLLFILYLPMTDMIHFIAKYFTYHEVRWDDEPQTTKMEKELNVLLAQPITWSASHVKADGKRKWMDIGVVETMDEEGS